jgi:hypothetical protein
LAICLESKLTYDEACQKAYVQIARERGCAGFPAMRAA